MDPLPGFLANQRIQQLHDEAASERLVRSSRTVAVSRAAWRRGAGAAARWLSATFADVATQLDPSICRGSYARE